MFAEFKTLWELQQEGVFERTVYSIQEFIVKSMIKKAMILAAGFGKRIHPLTLETPKPLLKIGEETLLSNTIKFLVSFSVPFS